MEQIDKFPLSINSRYFISHEATQQHVLIRWFRSPDLWWLWWRRRQNLCCRSNERRRSWGNHTSLHVWRQFSRSVKSTHTRDSSVLGLHFVLYLFVVLSPIFLSRFLFYANKVFFFFFLLLLLMPFSFLFLSLFLLFSLLLLNNELIWIDIHIQIKIVFSSVSGHLDFLFLLKNKVEK